jgi:AraC-like ligand binding domain
MPNHHAVQDFVDFSRRDDFDGLEVMRARWVRHSFQVHAHDFYNVALNYRGGGAFDCRGAQRDAVPGTCNLMAPGELHTGRATSEVGWIYRSLHLSPQLFVDRTIEAARRAPAGVPTAGEER